MKKRLFCVLCVLILALSTLAVTATAQVSAAAADDSFKAGYATVDINPYWSTYSGARKPATLKATDIMPLPMAGYGDNSHRLSSPALIDDNGDGQISGPDGDGLHATVLAMQSGNRTVLIITVDLINFKSAMTKQVRAKITELTGIPGTNIMINGTHTHGGVDMTATFKAEGEPYTSADGNTSYTAAECTAYLESYETHLVNQLATAATTAVADLSAATMEKGTIDAGVENGGKIMNGVRHYVQKYTERTGSVTYVRGSSFNNNVNNDSTYDSYYANAYTGKNPPDSWKATHVSDSDDALHLLRFKIEGKEDILLVNWRGHPASSNKTYKDKNGKTVNIYQNLYSDYIGSIRHDLAASGYRTTFILGASGNLGATSALSWEDWVNPQAQTNGVPFAVEYGKIVAATANALLKKSSATSSGSPMKAIESGPILTSQVKYRAAIQVPSALEAAACKAYQENAENIRSFDSYVYTDPTSGEKFVVASSYHANAVVNRSIYTEGTTRSMELDVITVGSELSFVAMPYEASDRYSMNATLTTANNYNDWDQLAQVGSFGTPFVMTCSNDHIGYIPNHLAYNYNKDSVHYGKYAEGSYESQTSLYKDGEGEKLIQVYKEMLEQMQVKDGYCQHCKKNVTWEPFNEALLTANGHDVPAGHYYLMEDLTYTASQVSIKGDSQVCLDLNGKTYWVAHEKNASRAFNMGGTSTLSIQDSSKEQTGKVMGRGVLIETAPDGFTCGTLNIGSGCTVNLYSGTLTQDTTEGYHATNAGVVKVSGTFNMYGGTVTGGKTTKSHGGNIYVDGGTFNMYGGTVSNGHAATQGGNIYISGTGKFNMSGGKITGGTADEGGPSVYAVYSSSNKNSIRLTGTTDGDAPVQITFPRNSLNMLMITGTYTGKVELRMPGSPADGVSIAKCAAGTDIGGASITVVGMGELAPVVDGEAIKLSKRLGWMQIGGKWYYFYETNKAQTGWYQEDGDWHYFDETGAMQTGWLELGENRYFLDENGHRVTGDVFTGDSYSRFDENGVWAEGIPGWYENAGKKLYAAEDGTFVTGFVTIEGKGYYFGSDYAMLTGWLDLDGTWYYFSPKGIMTTDWLAYGPVWYYFNDDGVMRTGWLTYGGQTYYFDKAVTNYGRMVVNKWIQDGSKWYYFNASGHRVTGEVTIDGKVNKFDANGVWLGEVVQNGWVKENNKWYYYKNGAKLTGWLDQNGTWYYFNPRGEMTIGWLAYGPVWYYFNTDGVMRTGWLTYGGQTYYFDKAVTNYGRMVVNKWIQDGGKWYYFNASGYRVSGTSMTIGGKVYNFDANGVCLNP